MTRLAHEGAAVQRRDAVAALVALFAFPSATTLLTGCDSPPAAEAALSHWPALAVNDLNDRAMVLPAHGPRPRLINVWALWCAPCRRELPSLRRLADVLAPREVDVCTLALADEAFAVREYLAQFAAGLTAVRLPPHAVAVQQLGLSLLPQTFVLAADGRVLARWRGARDWDAPTVRQALERLLRPG
jgi:thiol-disulfide isomerase/thioredoxin